MRTKWALFVLVMVTLVVMAYVPALNDFNTNQFAANGHNLSIKTAALTTNDQHYVVGAGSQSTFFSSGVEGIHFDNTGLWWLGNTAGNARIIQWNSPLLSLSAITQINPGGITMEMITNDGVFVYSNLTVRGGMILMSNANSGAFLFPTGTNFTFGVYATNAAGVLATNFWISNPGNIGGGFNFSVANTNKIDTFRITQDGWIYFGTNQLASISTNGIATFAGITNTGFSVAGVVTNAADGSLGTATFASILPTVSAGAGATVTGSVNANGSTNYSVAVSGGGVTTPTITQTNFVANTVYTNKSGSVQLLDATVALITTGVSGAAAMDLMVDQSGGNTFTLADRLAISTAVTTIAMNYTNNLFSSLSNNACYYFTNTSSGAGDSSVIVPGTGSLTTLSGGPLAPVRTVGITIDGGGSTITTGTKGYIVVPYDCTIVSSTMLADKTGSAVVDVWRCTYAQFDAGATHPVSADKLTASAPPTITASTKAQDTTLTGWTKTIAAGDVIAFNVTSASSVTRINLNLKVQP